MSTRLPLEPLEQIIEARYTDRDMQDGRDTPLAAWSSWAKETRAGDRRVVSRWRKEGLTVWAADKAACSIGLHPALVWGNAWWEATPAKMGKAAEAYGGGRP